MVIAKTRSSYSIWFQAVRAPFFTAAVIPVLLALVYALWIKTPVAWPLLPLIIMGMIFLHAGTNCINDYYDYINGVDKKTTFGSSRVLVDDLMPARHMFIESIILFSLGSIMGLIIVFWRGPVILAIGLLGVLGGYFYSAKPLGLKYLAWGDVMVFLLFGPLLIWGAYYAITGMHSLQIVLASVPLGFLVTGILHANNIRDMRTDSTAGIKTMALILGLRGSKAEYFLLLATAYIGVLLMAASGILPWHSLAVFLSLPLAIKNIQEILRVQEDDLKAIATMDVQTAQLHLVFGILFTLSLGLATILR
ncbi:MAG: 1,4-dihydroxy-2-naphthoate octaprenyltransferase [Candidatus Omnitrophica bacterium]|nr:1,4-dihydroxy-2-naphthoate octaprenyltransferase [Candidatus Omnitrophota bacterium]